MKGFIKSEEAVSQSIGFLLIFSLVILSVSIIYSTGYPLLLEARDANHIKNVEQSFIVLGYNVNRIIFGNTPSQDIEIRLSGGNLAASEESAMNITWNVWNETSSSLESAYQLINLTTIVYDFEGTKTAYEGGGVWVRYTNSGGTIMLSKPLIINDSAIIIPIGQSIGSISSKAGETGFARLKVKSVGPTDAISYENASNIKINIISEYYEGWERYLNETLRMGTMSYDINKTVTATFGQNNLKLSIVRRFLITEVL
ncbi:MAG: hypothetical protein SVM80_07600 [Halobacteriota archaeon]|nr:hypothetical protein [Halobacteriota archaeon]